MRVTGILKVLGWQKNFRMIAGKRVRVWCKQMPDLPTNTPNMGVDHEVDAEVVQAGIQSQQELENQTQQVDQPEQPTTTKKDIFSLTDTGIDTGIVGKAETSDSFGEKLDQVDRTNPTHTPQDFQTDQPDNCEVDPIQKTRLEATDSSTNAELVAFICIAIAENNSQFAIDIQVILRDACSNGPGDRQKVWDALTEAEKIAFTTLLSIPTPPTPPTPPIPTSEPISEPTSEPISATPATPEPTSPPAAESATESATESAATPRAQQEVISEEDAEKLRDIALIWWMEFYPDRMQSLVSQMYAWKAPGTKYEVATINQWLEGEDELVRDRINQLISLKNNNSTIEETP